MKKNRTMRVAVLMLALTLLTCCFVGSTFAKYTSSANGSDSVTVAKWNVTAQGTGDDAALDISGSAKEIDFDLFNTILDTTGAEEDAVVTGKIAPGTNGAFDLNVTNGSEVMVSYKIDFEVDKQWPTNFLFQVVVNGVEGEWKNSIDDVTGYMNFTDNKKVDVVVNWKWAFETDADSNPSNGISGDAADTADGVAANSYNVTVDITVEQIDKAPV
jgi:hypothetical protein